MISVRSSQYAVIFFSVLGLFCAVSFSASAQSLPTVPEFDALMLSECPNCIVVAEENIKESISKTCPGSLQLDANVLEQALVSAAAEKPDKLFGIYTKVIKNVTCAIAESGLTAVVDACLTKAVPHPLRALSY